jgi:hypothetical protein
MNDAARDSSASRGSLCGDTAVIAAIVSALVSVVVSGVWLAAWSDAEATRLNGVYLTSEGERWPRWVSVRERLPPADDGTPDATVLVWNRTDVIQAWREQDGHFTGVTGEHIPRVTHWMKMPEPPRE